MYSNKDRPHHQVGLKFWLIKTNKIFDLYFIYDVNVYFSIIYRFNWIYLFIHLLSTITWCDVKRVTKFIGAAKRRQIHEVNRKNFSAITRKKKLLIIMEIDHLNQVNASCALTKLVWLEIH